MNKIYLLVPLVAFALFAAIYTHYDQRRVQRIATYQAKLESERRAIREKEQRDRAAAFQAAASLREQRQAERLAKEEAEQARKQARTAAEEQGQRALERSMRLQRRFERLRADFDLAQAGLTRAEKEERELTDDQRFLAEYINEAEANRQGIMRFLEKIDALEKARLAAATKPTTTSQR